MIYYFFNIFIYFVSIIKSFLNYFSSHPLVINKIVFKNSDKEVFIPNSSYNSLSWNMFSSKDLIQDAKIYTFYQYKNKPYIIIYKYPQVPITFDQLYSYLSSLQNCSLDFSSSFLNEKRLPSYILYFLKCYSGPHNNFYNQLLTVPFCIKDLIDCITYEPILTETCQSDKITIKDEIDEEYIFACDEKLSI